jgi:hypothetical protein
MTSESLVALVLVLAIVVFVMTLMGGCQVPLR